MNNFIVGQVTPTMLKHIGFGTFVFFGVSIKRRLLFGWETQPIFTTSVIFVPWCPVHPLLRE